MGNSKKKMMESKKRQNPYNAMQELKLEGFTLLEVLLALSILALIVSAVYASFSTTGKNIEQAEIIRDGTDLARTLVSKLSDDIANTYFNANMNSATVMTIFYGKKGEVQIGKDMHRRDSLSLTTLTNFFGRRVDSKEMELWEVGYFFKEKPDGSGFILMRREKRELSKDIPAGEGGVEFQITDLVAGLQIKYNNGGDTWYDEWDSRTKRDIPKMVEFGLTLASGMTYSARVDVSSKLYRK
jgi:prepilin-type N-terminal cleavage/methylation domain-containing protein